MKATRFAEEMDATLWQILSVRDAALARRLLARLAAEEAEQAAARKAILATLELAEELRSLAAGRLLVEALPGCERARRAGARNRAPTACSGSSSRSRRAPGGRSAGPASSGAR